VHKQRHEVFHPTSWSENMISFVFEKMIEERFEKHSRKKLRERKLVLGIPECIAFH